DYQEQRYQAALAASDSTDEETLDTVYSNFYSLAREDYKDSGEHLVALEKENIRQTDPGDIVMFANLEWRVLTNEGSQALLIKDKSISGIPFQEQNKPVNWEDSHARRWLN